MGPAGAAVAPQVAALLKDPERRVRDTAKIALNQIARSGPLNGRRVALSCLSATHVLSLEEATAFLLQSYLYREIDQQDLILIRWLGRREPGERPSVPADRDRILEVLNTFDQAWEEASNLPDIQKDMAERISDLTRDRAGLEPRLLRDLEARLRQAGFVDQASTVRQARDKGKWQEWLFWLRQHV
jgi:hypothetical protein